tara:strand:- start:778 stop:1098 length:321 start_codon:yes stop_codon:yes gene_type:complete
MSLHEYILAQGPQNNNRPTSTLTSLGSDLLDKIMKNCSDHTLFLFELASKNLCGYTANLVSQTTQKYYDSDDDHYDGYDKYDELYNDDHLDYEEQEFDDDFELPEY